MNEAVEYSATAGRRAMVDERDRKRLKFRERQDALGDAKAHGLPTDAIHAELDALKRELEELDLAIANLDPRVVVDEINGAVSARRTAVADEEKAGAERDARQARVDDLTRELAEAVEVAAEARRECDRRHGKVFSSNQRLTELRQAHPEFFEYDTTSGQYHPRTTESSTATVSDDATSQHK